MLQIKTFKLEEDEKANKFIEDHNLIENGVQIRDNCIVVLYDNSIDFDEKAKTVSLITKLASTEASLLAARIEHEYYVLLEGAEKMSTEHLAAQEKNRGAIDNFTAQAYIIRKMLGYDTGEPVIFGKKMYGNKDKKHTK